MRAGRPGGLMHWKHLSDTREMRPAYSAPQPGRQRSRAGVPVYRSTRRNFVRKRALRLTLGAVAGLGAIALFPTIANAQEPDPVDRARPAGQPAVGRHRCGPGHLHAGGIRARRDRLLSGEARGPRRLDELRHLRPRLHRLLLHRFPACLRRVQYDPLIGLGCLRSANRSSGRGTGCSCSREDGR